MMLVLLLISDCNPGIPNLGILGPNFRNFL